MSYVVSTKPWPWASHNHADKVWRNMLGKLVNEGLLLKIRGREVFEIPAVQSAVSMRRPMVTSRTGLGYRFMAAEAAWILSGDDKLASIAPYSKQIGQFSDDGIRFFGAYGPKIMEQLPYVAEAIVKDLHTRQAVINIWRESPPATKDVPCTLSLQWLVRENSLLCIVTMRSSDAWLGWPYDIFNMSMVSYYLLLLLKRQHGISLRPGAVVLTAGSQHLYVDNFDAAKEVLAVAPKKVGKGIIGDVSRLASLYSPDDLVKILWRQAQKDGAFKGMQDLTP